MTIDKTEARATNRIEPVERTKDQITVINLENPRDGKKVHEMWKTSISQDKNIQLRMQSARTVTK